MTYSFIDFIGFALLSHQRFDDRPLFKPGALCLICHHFELPKNKYFCLIKIIFAKANSQKCTVCIDEKISHKRLLERFHLFIELHLYICTHTYICTREV